MSTFLASGKRITLISLAFCCFILSACSENSENTLTTKSKLHDRQIEIDHQAKNIRHLLKDHHPAYQKLVDIIEGHFSRLLDKAKDLDESINLFAKTPSSENLNESVIALDKVHDLYVSSDILGSCCFFDNEAKAIKESVESHISLRSRLDQHPLLAGYLDSVEGYPYSGLIHTDIPITIESIEQEFQLGDPSYVTLGFHALEVMLKGSDITRSVSDFSVISNSNDSSSASPELRRTLYITLLSSEIRYNLSTLKANWYSKLQEMLTLQLAEQATEFDNTFLSELQLKLDKALTATQLKQKRLLEQNSLADKHTNPEILREREALLKELLSINEGS